MADEAPIEIKTQFVSGFGSGDIAVLQVGEGRPVLMLHGLFSNAHTNWVKYGTADRLMKAGFRLIMPDLRAHGLSAASHDAADYPAEILALDVEALVEALGLDDFDLVGFSLGARTAAKLMIRGLRPRRAVLGGMGLEGLTGWPDRRDFFLHVIEARDTANRGDRFFLPAQFMKQMKIDPVAARLLLESFGDLAVEELRRIAVPTLVVCGAEDDDNGSAEALVEALPDAKLRLIPGNHMSSVTKPELAQAIVDFLNA